MLDDERGEPLRVARLKFQLSLVVVKRKMPPLVLGQAPQNLGKHGILRPAGQHAVAFQRGKL